MRILLTGHKGFLGREIHKVLTKENALVVHGEDSDNYRAFLSWFEDTDFSHYDLVIHCGAISDSRQCDNELWQMNYQASCRIATACAQSNTKLLFISSATAIEPDTPYGWSKQCAEYHMRNRVPGMDLCILRPYNIWAFDEEGKANPSIVYKMLTQQLKQIYWECTRDFIYISDVVDAIQQVVHDWTPGTFDIGTAKPMDVCTLANELYGLINPDKPPIVENCPIKERLVARSEHLLPNWKADPITEHLASLRDRLMFKQVAHVHSSAEIDYSAEDH